MPDFNLRKMFPIVTLLVAAMFGSSAGFAQTLPNNPSGRPPSAIPTTGQRDVPRAIDEGAGNRPLAGMPIDVNQMTSPQGFNSSLKLMLMLTVLSLAPSILMMTTCFIRFVVVMGLLRQALGTQQLPPNQVIVAMCLFLTFMVMAPVWNQAYQEGIRPYTSQRPGETTIDEATAFTRTAAPIRRFMSEQIDRAGNAETVWMFLDFQRPAAESPWAKTWKEPETYEDIPLTVLVPAYMLSELKVAFVIGFQIYLPFIVIDLVVSSILMSMGMMMLPPGMISLPFKLMLFVLIDGWQLVVGMLLESVRLTS